MRVLIVDDESVKERSINALIEHDDMQIETASTKRGALTLLRNNKYDLMILDIMIPDDEKTIPVSKRGGIELIEQLNSLRNINLPREIICITSNKELSDELKDDLQKYLIPILYFQLDEEEWRIELNNKINYIYKTMADQIKADIAIVTAVNDEFESVKAELSDTRLCGFPDDPITYYVGRIKVGEQNKTVVVMKLNEMGLTATSNSVTKIIMRFNPDKIFMVGICGGLKGKVELGDIIVAKSSWDYGSGKIFPQSNKDGKLYYDFKPEPQQIAISTSVLDAIEKNGEGLLAEVEKDWNERNENDKISVKMHISPLASGAAVVADENIISEIIEPQNRRCVGIDMETYGFYFAVKNTSKKDIEFLSIKAVSDFADKDKNDDYHKKCCFTSARFLRKCLEAGVL